MLRAKLQILQSTERSAEVFLWKRNSVEEQGTGTKKAA